jgi:hypothetical protein
MIDRSLASRSAHEALPRAADQARALLIGAIHVESPSTGGRRRRPRRGSPRPGGHGRWSGLLATGLTVAVTPLTVTGQPSAGPGLQAALLGTTKRAGGGSQVTYAAIRSTTTPATASPVRPPDRASLFGAKWYVLSAGGAEITRS